MNEIDPSAPPSFRLIAVIALCIGVGAGAWAFFAFIIPSMSDDGKTVYIQADKSPIKTSPDQPGGMDIPHQDKLVFNAVTPGVKTTTPDHLAPAPEQPAFDNQASLAVAPPGQPAPGETDAPGAQQAQPVAAPTPVAAAPTPPAGPQPMPVALGRAIAPAAGETQPTPIAATQAVKATEPAASFDFGKDSAGNALTAPKPAAVAAPAIAKAANAAVAKPAATEKLVAENQAVSQDLNINDPAKVVTEDGSAVTTATDRPVLPPAHVPPTADAASTVATDDATDDSDDNTVEDVSPPATKKAKPFVATTKPEDEAVAYKPSSASARFQLASYTDRAAAQKAIGSFRSKYSDAVSKASLTVVSGTAKGRQVFRVQGSASSKDEAASICSRVKAKGGSCVITR